MSGTTYQSHTSNIASSRSGDRGVSLRRSLCRRSPISTLHFLLAQPLRSPVAPSPFYGTPSSTTTPRPSTLQWPGAIATTYVGGCSSLPENMDDKHRTISTSNRKSGSEAFQSCFHRKNAQFTSFQLIKTARMLGPSRTIVSFFSILPWGFPGIFRQSEMPCVYCISISQLTLVPGLGNSVYPKSNIYLHAPFVHYP